MKAFAALALVPLAGPALAQSDTTRVDVALSNFKFTPSTIALRHGQSYVLHLVNDGGGGHDFVAPEFFAAATIAPHDRGKVTKGEIELHGGQSVDVRLVAPATPASYKLKCSHFLHATLGMTGTITVS